MADANMIQCPHCGQPYFVQPYQWAQYLGQTIHCTRCAEAFTVAVPFQPPGGGEVRPLAPDGMATDYAGLHPFYTRGLYPAPPVRTSAWAITSLVLGVLSFGLPVLASLGAIGTAIGGLVQTRERRSGGRGLAIAGLGLGLFTLVVLTPLLVAVILPTVTKGREVARRIKCAANLNELGIALTAYAGLHDNRFPDQLDDLAELSPPPPVWAFVCPSDNKTPPAAAPASSMAADISTGEHCSYVYVGAGLRAIPDPRIVVLYEPLGNHNREGMNVLFADGHSQWLSGDDAQTILEQRVKGTRPIRLNLTGPTTDDSAKN